MMRVRSRPGYIFLLAVLGVGIIVATTSFSLMLMGWAAEQNGRSLEEGAQALANARTCAERALALLREDTGYHGDASMTLVRGSCVIAPMCGAGNAERVLQVMGVAGKSMRRLEIDIAQLRPETLVRRWEEVALFSVCP